MIHTANWSPTLLTIYKNDRLGKGSHNGQSLIITLDKNVAIAIQD